MDWFQRLDRGSREMIVGMGVIAALFVGVLITLDGDYRGPERATERSVQHALGAPDLRLREVRQHPWSYPGRLVCGVIEQGGVFRPVAATASPQHSSFGNRYGRSRRSEVTHLAIGDQIWGPSWPRVDPSDLLAACAMADGRADR